MFTYVDVRIEEKEWVTIENWVDKGSNGGLRKKRWSEENES